MILVYVQTQDSARFGEKKKKKKKKKKRSQKLDLFID